VAPETHGLLNYPGSDLLDVIAGRKSFQAALNSPAKMEVERATNVNSR